MFCFYLLFFFECLGIQFLVHSHVTFGTLCHTRGHSHSYLGKRRISIGVAIILSICISILQKFLFVVKTLIKNILFFWVQFWKKNFFPGSVLKIFFSKFSFKNIIFFQVQFLKIFFSRFSSKNFFFSGSFFKMLFSSRFSFKNIIFF